MGITPLLCLAACLLLVPVSTQSYFSAPFYSNENDNVYMTPHHDVASARESQILGYGVQDEHNRLYDSTYGISGTVLGMVEGLISQPNLLPKQGSGYVQQQPSGYPSSSGYTSHPSSGGYGQSSHGSKSGYGLKKKKKKKKKQPKTEKIYVPVPVKKPKRKKKKKKTLSVSKGFFVHGGSLLFGKFKTLKACQKACDNTASCFAGDYDKWTRRCYAHTNSTACDGMTARKGTTHFKKVPCSLTNIGLNYARITLGANLDHGLLQKGIKNIQSCIRKCAEAGGGALPAFTGASAQAVIQLMTRPQLCFGIDYDFSTHKCYFHTSVNLYSTDARVQSMPAVAPNLLQGVLGGIICFFQDVAPTRTTPLGPQNLVSNPNSINIVICPRPT